MLWIYLIDVSNSSKQTKREVAHVPLKTKFCVQLFHLAGSSIVLKYVLPFSGRPTELKYRQILVGEKSYTFFLD